MNLSTFIKIVNFVVSVYFQGAFCVTQAGSAPVRQCIKLVSASVRWTRLTYTNLWTVVSGRYFIYIQIDIQSDEMYFK